MTAKDPRTQVVQADLRLGSAGMPPALYAVGEAAAAGEVEVTVSSVSIAAAGGGEQRLRIVVAYQIRNISPAKIRRSDLSPLVLESPAGGTVAPLEAATGTAGDLAPAGTVGQQVTFEVPDGGFDRSLWRLRYGGPQGPRIRLR